MSIRRNKDGKQNLGDLRKALEERSDVELFREGTGWVVSEWSEQQDAWVASPVHPRHDERAALQIALFGEPEREEETATYAK